MESGVFGDGDDVRAVFPGSKRILLFDNILERIPTEIRHFKYQSEPFSDKHKQKHKLMVWKYPENVKKCSH